MGQILSLLKADLGITHDKRDAYFNALLQSAKIELEGKGMNLNIEDTADMCLISDYAAWSYRKRGEDVGLPRNLQRRIRNKVIKRRAENV